MGGFHSRHRLHLYFVATQRTEFSNTLDCHNPFRIYRATRSLVGSVSVDNSFVAVAQACADYRFADNHRDFSIPHNVHGRVRNDADPCDSPLSQVG